MKNQSAVRTSHNPVNGCSLVVVVRSFNVAISNFRAAVGHITEYTVAAAVVLVCNEACVFVNNREVFNHCVAENFTYQATFHKLELQGMSQTVQDTVKTIVLVEVRLKFLRKAQFVGIGIRTAFHRVGAQVLRYDVVTVNVGSNRGIFDRVFFAGNCRVVEEGKEVGQFVNNACIRERLHVVAIPFGRFHRQGLTANCVCLNFFFRQCKRRPLAPVKVSYAVRCANRADNRFLFVQQAVRHKYYAVLRGVQNVTTGKFRGKLGSAYGKLYRKFLCAEGCGNFNRTAANRFNFTICVDDCNLFVGRRQIVRKCIYAVGYTRKASRCFFANCKLGCGKAKRSLCRRLRNNLI